MSKKHGQHVFRWTLESVSAELSWIKKSPKTGIVYRKEVMA